MQETRPIRVKWALTALWAAWVVGFMALFVNQLFFRGSGIGPGWVLGILGLTIQAVLFTFVARGDLIARTLTVAFLVLAMFSLPMLGRLIAEKSAWSAIYIAAGFALKAVGVFLLFTVDAKEWFSSQADRLESRSRS